MCIRDSISSNRTLLPVVTLIIMETFISKMRRLKGVRKMILIEECWKALTSANMSSYIRYLCAPVQACLLYTSENIEIHHVKRLKDLKGKEPWKIQMIGRQRKTLAVCIPCHNKIHHGIID